ncbi:TPA: hypothetical protein ACH3X1_014400 [Trebouxia sp. C0004]
MAHRQPLQVSTPSVPGYAEQLFGVESSPMQGSEAPGLPTSSNVFLPRSARTNLTHSMRSGSGSPRGSNMFLPGAHRADSIEAILAAIPSRFSTEKSLSLDSSSSSSASSRLMAGAHPVPNVAVAIPSMRAVPSSSAASPQPVYGMAAIPSRRSRDVPGLQPEAFALINAPGAHGGHVTESMGNGDMPRTFSGKVRKLKQHRRASASRLRPPDPPPSSSMVRATPAQTEPQQAESTLHMPGHAQQDVQAQHAKHAQQTSRIMPEQLQQQPGFENPHAHHMPAVVQHPGFDLHQQTQQQRQGQVVEMPCQLQPFEPGYSKHIPQSQNCQQGMQLQAQVHRQLPDQLPAQQLQQQSSIVRGSCRQRPTEDAAWLTCFGKAVPDTEAGRMTQSGPLQSGLLQEPSGAAAFPVPELFEAYHVRPRGRGTGTLDHRLASLDRMFQKLPPGETRRRRRLQAISQSAPALPGTLPCQGCFILTPGTAAIPKEISLNPKEPAAVARGTAAMPRELSLNPQQHSQDQGSAAALSPGALSGHSPRLGLSPSPAVFEFARNPTAAHISTAKLCSPQLLDGQIGGSAAKLPRVKQAEQDPSAEATLAWACQNGNSEEDRGKCHARGRAVRSSLEGGPVRNPRTSVEDFSQMQSCLNQLEQQLVQIPRPSSRGLASKPHIAEADNASVHRKLPLHMHLQQPGEALGQPNSLRVSGNEALSFLRPSSQQSQQSGPVRELVHEEEEQRSRPSSAGSLASQPEFAMLKARVSASRQAGK